MSWENILKRPMGINVRSDRDNQFRQAIIRYDKEVITPAIEQVIQRQSAGENAELQIYFRQYSADSANSSGFGIGTNAVGKLGGNEQFILTVLDELYKGEGYNTQIKGDRLTFSQ